MRPGTRRNGFSQKMAEHGISARQSSFLHLDLDNIDVHTYTADIAHQDQILGRWPAFLLDRQAQDVSLPIPCRGSTLIKRNKVRQYFFSNGYRIAEVTTDYMDWTWTDAYRRCLIHHDEKAIDWLRAHVNDAADRYLSLSVEMARKLFHRDINQILLIHIGAFDALTLDGILREWRSKGVKLIPLEEALKDPVYKINPNLPNQGGLSFLEQIAEARDFDTRPFVENTYTIESLKKVCEQPTAAH